MDLSGATGFGSQKSIPGPKNRPGVELERAVSFFKASSKLLQSFFKASSKLLQSVFKASSKRLQSVFKASSKRLLQSVSRAS